MFTRNLSVQNKKSFFLLGQRGTGKSTWIRSVLKSDVYLDLLDPSIYHRLLAAPENLPAYIPAKTRGWVAIAEVQRIPELLNVVHQLIETRGLAFALTGSSARKLSIRAIEVKSSPRLARDDLTGLRAFRTDYPEADCTLIYGGNKELEVDGIAIRPAAEALGQLKDFI